MGLLDRAIVRALPAVPRPVVRRLSERYIAGAALEDACGVVARLNAVGKAATIDVLGEEITNLGEATLSLRSTKASSTRSSASSSTRT